MESSASIVNSAYKDRASAPLRFFREMQEVPVIDLLCRDEDQVAQFRASCEEWGFFQLINHGIDEQLLRDASDCCRGFFGLPIEDKIKLSCVPPMGFVHQSQQGGVVEKREHLLVLGLQSPNFHANLWPQTPENFRLIIEKLLANLSIVGRRIMEILAESFGIPKASLSERYQSDALLMHFYPATQADYAAPVLSNHKDNRILTIVFQQNQVDSLQILKNSEWITVKPVENALIVNIGDVMQVWTNALLQSVSHRVVPSTEDRHSFAFFTTPDSAMEIAPLPPFTLQLNRAPKYKPFVFADYVKHRNRNKMLESASTKVFTIQDYEINTEEP